MLPLQQKRLGDVFTGKRVLDIGCGRKKLSGAVGLDRCALPGVDVVADLDDGHLPFGTESFDVVSANQVLEHVRDLVRLVGEVHRVLRPGGLLVAHVPYFRSSWAHIDPTHVRSFTINSMDYFVDGTHCHEHYRFHERAFRRIQVILDNDFRPRLARGLFAALALRFPNRFENSFLSNLFVFQQLTYVLEK
ncbi:MAG TPA: methyltransferase domain-containing protein [Burkholderiales bacterium]|jgi:SAM-dependent methyltransferase|nr:methyltransferase domain-containing protein [Burkholderiales bacterium]